ncbi:MAG: phosphatase PAP2 family protein [Gemmatimonadales bacterium]
MRNRPRAVACMLLFMVAGLLQPALLGAQTRAHALADLAELSPRSSLLPAPVDGPGPVPLPATRDDHPQVIRWYHGLLFMGAVAALTPLDEPVRNGVQDLRSGGSNDVARVIRHVGQPEVYATVALGTVAAGLVSGNANITRAGARITSGIVLGGATVALLKFGIGRRRPFSAEDQYTFGPFSKADASFPSGHTMTAFALATGVSDEVHSVPVTIGMYTLATGVAWSRMNDNKHWLSDVVAGAAIGITSVKLMNGRWRVFGISAPKVLLGPGAVGVSLSH